MSFCSGGFLLSYAVGSSQPKGSYPAWAKRVWLVIGIGVVLFGIWLFSSRPCTSIYNPGMRSLALTV